MTQYAKFERKNAPLHSDFARSMLARWYGGDGAAAYLIAKLPTYARGKNKGLVKGWLHWDKVTEGGWHRDGDRSGVLKPSTRNVRITLGFDADGAAFKSREHFASSITDSEWLAYIDRGLADLIARFKPARW